MILLYYSLFQYNTDTSVDTGHFKQAERRMFLQYVKMCDCFLQRLSARDTLREILGQRRVTINFKHRAKKFLFIVCMTNELLNQTPNTRYYTYMGTYFGGS